MWPYYEPRVRFAGPRSGRQRETRFDDGYDGAAARPRPWRSYTDDEERRPAAPRPVPVRVYGRSADRPARRRQPQPQPRPALFREAVVVQPPRLRAAPPARRDESFGRDEVAFVEPAAPMTRLFDEEQQQPERRFMASEAVTYDDVQQADDAEDPFGLPADGGGGGDDDEKPGGNGPGLYAWPEHSSAPSQRAPSLIMGDDVDVLDAFDFVFPRAQSSLSSLSKDRELAEMLDSLAGASAVDDAARPPAPSTATRAFSSTYTGDAELGGVHGATLTVLHDPKGRRRPLFHWLHIQQDVMNLDEFWAEIPRQVRLSEAEMAATAKLRADVKRHAVKSRQSPKGAHVGYMDPRYFQVPLKDASAPEAAKKQQQQYGWSPPAAGAAGAAAAARWICLPYFSLQRCAGLVSASSLAAFPPLTLLQSHYSRTPQQRDLQQAVCELGAVRRGDCFHVAQLWCLVLDNTLLVTCGSMAQSDLYGDSLKLVPQPAKAQSNAAEAGGRILVSYGSAVTWTLDAQDCPTWFSLLARFASFWPRNFEFTWRDRVVTPDSWPKILKVAARPQGSVSLSLRTVPRPDPPKTTLEPAQGPRAAGAEQGPEDLHVLTLGPADSAPPADAGAAPSAADLEGLHRQLEAAERFLLSNTSYAQQRAYRGCGAATRAAVRAHLADRGGEVEARASDSIRRAYDDRVDIFNAAGALFQLFFPGDFDGPTTTQYWASVRTLVAMPSFDGGGDAAHPPVDPDVLRELRAHLRDMSQDIAAFQSIVAHAGDADRAAMDLPRPFVTAWLHVVSSMLSVGAPAGQGGLFAHLAKARLLIDQGMHSLVQGLPPRSLVEALAVLPMEVVSLIAMDLLQDQVGKADDVAETYSQYLSSLDTDITTKPSDRSYQHRIELVQQEMSAVKKTLARQRHVVGAIRSSLPAGPDVVYLGADDGPGRRRSRREATPASDQPPAYREAAVSYYASYQQPAARRADYLDAGRDDVALDDLEAASKLQSTDALGFRGLFLAECARIVDQREFDFRRHTEFAEDLERAAAYKVGWTKDRQENAIYAFTIVTIVFLPISAISSIFGMNTSDVRNMASGQWLYWVVAVPVTLGVIFVGLWWMNELGNVVQWTMGKRPDRSSGAGNTASWWMSQVPGIPYLASAPQGNPDTAPATPYSADLQAAPVSARWRRYSEDLQPAAAAPQLRRRAQTMYMY